MSVWLNVIGIGEDGWDGLTPPARDAILRADVIIGGARHHALAPQATAERIKWPSPFSALTDKIAGFRGRQVVVLVTGDPLWYSAGARFLKVVASTEIAFHPNTSAFQLACARMGWSLADVDTLTVHGRPVEQCIPFFAPGARLVILTQDAETPSRVAGLLSDHGYGASQMTVLGAMGGSDEVRRDGTAQDWAAEAPDFHTLCVTCEAGDKVTPHGVGLPDDAFEHDGKMTKREMRVLTLAALRPQRGALLWDIGCGCGSVAIEWLRAARDTRAIGIEPHEARRQMAARNARHLGAPRLQLIDAHAPAALQELPAPDAIFIGGGLSAEIAHLCLSALSPHGRLVANAVTLESEAILAGLHATLGGQLIRLSVARADGIGDYRGWRPHMPVTQWSLTR